MTCFAYGTVFHKCTEVVEMRTKPLRYVWRGRIVFNGRLGELQMTLYAKTTIEVFW